MSFGPLVDADWLEAHLDEPDLVVVDVRWYLDGRSGRDAYEAGHIPGAAFADLDADLADPPSASGGRHPLPAPDRFAASMSALGIGDDTRVVAYDDAGGIIAARLWWMLDTLGHEAAVLDGGIQAWTGELDGGAPVVHARAFTATEWPANRLISGDELEAALRTDLIVLDARSAERYAHGGPVDARGGHVPGARSAPATANHPFDGRFGSAAWLRSRYLDLGVGARSVVAYCGSGVTACADLLALRRAGLPDGRLFVGSWSAWGADESRPVVEGPEPG